MNEETRKVIYSCITLIVYTLYSLYHNSHTINDKAIYLICGYIFIIIILSLYYPDTFERDIVKINLFIIGIYMLMDIGNLIKNLKYFVNVLLNRA